MYATTNELTMALQHFSSLMEFSTEKNYIRFVRIVYTFLYGFLVDSLTNEYIFNETVKIVNI